MTASIYTASKVPHASLWRVLRTQGFNIRSTWIDEAGPGETSDFADLWRRCVSEASTCDVLLAYKADPGEVFKGAFIEIGAALAHGRPVFLVGHFEESFTHHPLVRRFAWLPDALDAIRMLPRDPAAPGA